MTLFGHDTHKLLKEQLSLHKDTGEDKIVRLVAMFNLSRNSNLHIVVGKQIYLFAFCQYCSETSAFLYWFWKYETPCRKVNSTSIFSNVSSPVH